MSLKGVELQIAIPKTFDAGKLQEQAMQSIHANQDMSNEALKKQLEKNNTLLLESAEIKNLRQDEPNKDTPEEHHERQKRELEEAQEKEKMKAKHPFKGNLFDYSG